MHISEYFKSLKNIKLGKHLPSAVYLHKEALSHLDNPLVDLLQETNLKNWGIEAAWNVVKFHKKQPRISLLYYPQFFEESYPKLSGTTIINLETNEVSLRNYEHSKNPPILHRKETFLPPDHPDLENFMEITTEGEQAGLYTESRKIGFQKQWLALIEEKGFELIEGRLKKRLSITGQESKATPKIERHKTAIDRSKLSIPMFNLAKYGYLDGENTVFDFGCGKGDDLRILQANGINAEGWDPIYRVDSKLKSSDVVNLGFVINVIENIQERRKTIAKAFSLAKKVISISAMIGGEATISQFKPFKDGVITSRNTFQKYFSQTELKQFIEEVLKRTAFPVAPGVFFAFKDDEWEQRFLVAKEQLLQSWTKLSYTAHPEKLKIRQKALFERHKELFESYFETWQKLGRPPKDTEFTQAQDLRLYCGSTNKAINLITEIYGQEAFKSAHNRRTDDLLVFFALIFFGRRSPVNHFPPDLKADISYFFNNYTTALDKAKILLFSIGKPENIRKACLADAARLKTGFLEGDHSYTIHKNRLNELTPLLRVYIGCARMLYGDLDSVDLIKIHMTSGKVTFLIYDQFEKENEPLLIERIKVNLRHQNIDFFEYGDQFPSTPLLNKECY